MLVNFLIQLSKLFLGLDWAAVVCPFLIPISLLWDYFILWRLKIRFWLHGGQGECSESHINKVERVKAQVKLWKVDGEGRKMCSARPSWMSISQQKLGYKDKMYRVQVADLQDILDVNKDDMTVTVEPGVTIGHLNKVLVSQGVTLPVVPELDTLTIGGLLMGGGIESTSHKYGLFHDLCIEYHLVTADGEVVVVREDNENSDIFAALPMSYGTLGFVVLAKLNIVKYKPFIRLTYWSVSSLEAAMQVFERETKRETGNDSVEGIAYSKDSAVIMTGVFVDRDEVDWRKVNRMGLWYKPWFYLYVEKFLHRSDDPPEVEYVPTLHFHQRHNKPCFWLAHEWLPWASGPIARLLTGWALPMNHQLLQLVRDTAIGGDMADNCVLQDFILPLPALKEGVELSHVTTGLYPLWMVPAKMDLRARGGKEDEIFVDLGVYGFSHDPKFAGREKTLRKFELFTIEKKGFQALYAETLMSYEEFNTMFKGLDVNYKKARNRIPFCEEAFPETYQKVSRQGRQTVTKNKKEE